MRLMGIDIGTTTISAVVLDTQRCQIAACINVQNTAAYTGKHAYERLQNPERIAEDVLELTRRMRLQCGGIDAIGLDGQMHGMLYVDEDGKAVSPLYTWQDGHGDQDCGGETFAQRLSRLTGCAMASGYGLTTHDALRRMGRVPARAAKICTIADYAAMRLTGRKTPLCHVSNAASMGLFDGNRCVWDEEALIRADLSREILPETTDTCCVIGEDAVGAPVACAIGDNQASFIGSVAEPERSVLVNVGTGGQVSMAASADQTLSQCEQRPLNGRQRLLVGSSLCGGRTYAMLHDFFADCVRMAGCRAENLYEQMNAAAMSAMDAPRLTVDTRFCGSRKDPQARGSILGISEGSLNAGQLAAGTLMGMADELHAFYREMTGAGARPAEVMIASGNGVRRNPALRRALRQRFDLPVWVPEHLEEAAFGAAMSAALAAGGEKAYDCVRRMIRYEQGSSGD